MFLQFCDNVTAEKRSEEQSALEKASFLQSIITSLVPMIPVIASVVMFIAYILTGNDLDVAEVTNQPLPILLAVRPELQ